jgi:SRSO17 transposase
VEFATKTELARQMLGRALDAGVPASWVTADEAYGKDHKFRSWLEGRRIGYVVAVLCNQAVPGSTGTSVPMPWPRTPRGRRGSAAATTPGTGTAPWPCSPTHRAQTSHYQRKHVQYNELLLEY